MTSVHIDKVVYGGSGLGRLPDGRAVFVPFTAPGDDADIEVVTEHPRHAEATLRKLRSASVERDTPRCPHFEQCGGCQYQHIKYPAQVRIKRDQLTETLQRLGQLRELPPVSEPIPSPQPFNYRSKLSLHRFENEHGRPQFGFATRDGTASFTPQECHLPLPRLWKYAQAQLANFAEHPETIPAEAQRITVRAPGEGDCFHFFDRGTAQTDWLTEVVGNRRFAVPPGAFWQVNPGILPSLIDIVQNWIGDGGRSLVDAYGGVGLFSVMCGAAYAERTVIETNRQALRAARQNHETLTSGVTRYLPMPAEVALKKSLQKNRRNLPATTVLLDPPRAGCAPEVLHALTALKPRRIVYVSCDPATLARDLRKLTQAGNYRIQRLAILDMFPQTAHFETVALLDQN
ncbi:MAG: class I SAM-dependent RNA methyltransferase [bacterium]